MKKVFLNLKELMGEKKLNIKKIKEKTSLSRTTISNLLNHYSNGIQFDTLAVLCDVLDCSPGDLLVIHDIFLHFEEKEASLMELSNDKDGIVDIIDMTLNCNFILDDKTFDFDFKIECTFWYLGDGSVNYEIEQIQYSVIFQHFLKHNEFPLYIVDYLEKSLKEFIEDWITVWVSNYEP